MAEYGNEFIGLLPTISKRGNRNRRLEPQILSIMQEEILSENGVKSKAAKGLFTCWSVVMSRCKEKGLVSPSRKTFYSEIKRLMTPEEFKKARQGEKAGYDLEIPYLSLERDTPKHGCRAFELGHIDHTQIDLQMVDESNGANMGKAWLTVLIDAFTRVILAWVILFDEAPERKPRVSSSDFISSKLGVATALRLLLCVHGVVCMNQQGVNGAAVFWVLGNADADADRQIMAV